MAPSLTADQVESTLARLRSADYDGGDETVQALLDRMDDVGSKRQAAKVRGWFGAKGDAEQAKADRASAGTLAQQRSEYREYIDQLAQQIEDRGRGSGGVTRAVNGAQARGEGRVDLPSILTSSPDTIRKRLSPEALELLAEIGPPLSFDAWRHEFKGARDPGAVRSHQNRTSGFFSEYG